MTRGTRTLGFICLLIFTLTFVALSETEAVHSSTHPSSSLQDPTVVIASASDATENRTAKHFHLIVSQNGFNNTQGNLVLVVTEGEAVTIEFVYGDSELPFDNPHRMFLDGYNLQTDTISKAKTTTVVQFVATRSGSFAIYCDIPCAGMAKLQNTLLRVAQSSASLLPSLLVLGVHQEEQGGSTLHLLAKLSDAAGRPLSGIPIDFFAKTTFGLMPIGTAVTDSEGLASLEYRPMVSGGTQFVAAFSGGGSLAPSETMIAVDVKLATGSAEQQSIIGLSRGFGLALLTIVVSSVWVSYGAVLNLVRRIRLASHVRPSRGMDEALSPPTLMRAFGFFSLASLTGILGFVTLLEFFNLPTSLVLPSALVFSAIVALLLVLSLRRFGILPFYPDRSVREGD